MTLQQRIQDSAAELGKLLRQAEKQHRRFLKRRDARMRVSAPWTPDGHPLVFIVRESGIDVAINSRDLATRVSKALAAKSKQNQEFLSAQGIAAPGIEHEIPFDNGKAFAIDNKTAVLAHAHHGALARQINSVVEQIDSKLNAVLEIHGTKAIFQDPASKIVFYVEISRIGDKLGNQVKYMIKAD